MAELIDKDEALKLFDNCAFQNMNYVTVKGRLNTLSTVTEAEIRAKAIDEFAEKLNKKITDFVLEHQSQLTFVSGVSMGWKFVDEIAEQLKEE